MKLKTLSFNRGILIQDIRNVGWVGLVYFICLLFALPIQLFMLHTKNDPYHYFVPPDNLFAQSTEFQVFIAFTLPILLAVFLFRYLHVKLASDYTHSLPIKRETLFIQHTFLGIIILILPVLAAGGILLLSNQFLPYDELLSFNSILLWMAVTILFSVFAFITTVFVGMFTGMSILHAVLTYILFVLPVGLSTLLLSNLEFYLFGFTANYYLSNQLDNFIPFIRMGNVSYQPLLTLEVISYLLMITIFYALSLLAYKKRHTETATQAISFSFLRPVFKYGVTFCAMLVGGLYFGTAQGDLGWTIFGYISASIIGYLLASMILEKTWRVFHQWREYLLFFIAASLIGMTVHFDIIGFEDRVPKIDEIELVYFGDSVYFFRDQHARAHFMEDQHTIERSYQYETKESIENIKALHEQIVQDKQHLKDQKSFSHSVAFAYELENGDTIVRQYQVPVHIYQKHYRDIIELEEYRINQNPIITMRDELSSLTQITINDFRTGSIVNITDPAKQEELYEVITADIYEETYEEAINYDTWHSEIEFIWSDKRALLSWKKSYAQLDQWLKDQGLLDHARVTANDLSHAMIIKKEDATDLYEFIRTENLEQQFEHHPNAVRIEEPGYLEEALKKSSNNREGEYVIGFYYKNQTYPEFYVFTQEQIPTFIQSIY